MKITQLSVLAVVALLVTTLTTAAFAGTYYEARIDSDQKRAHESIRSWVDGDRAKIIYAGGGFGAKGSYMVTQDGGKVVYLVDPAKQTYSEFDLEELLGAVGTAMQALNQSGGAVSFDFKDGWSEREFDRSGGSLHGCATRHVQWKSGYTMEMMVIGMKRLNTVATVHEAWLCNKWKDLGFGVWLRNKPPSSGDPDLDKSIQAGWVTMTGFPLKTVTKTTTTNKRGKSQTTTSTMEVTTLRPESTPGSLFEIPAGYTETDLMSQMEGESQADRGEKKPGKRGQLKGLFGRKKKDG